MRDSLIKRRYRIEASTPTLARFVSTLSTFGVKCFVQSIKCDVNEEYYYVVLIAEQQAHDALKLHGFTDSIARPIDPS